MSLIVGAFCACQLAAASPAAPPLTVDQLVARARATRYQQDTTLSDYVAIARQRWSAGIGVAPPTGLGVIGRMRLAARFEAVARVGWHHERGAWGELLASRAVAPIGGDMEPDGGDDDIFFALPFAPGRDRLWPMSEMVDALPRGLGPWIRHPLEAGSDSVYRFALGGPLAITLPDGKRIDLRELLVRPVRPDDRLIVGSLWLDVADGALVRAAYRPSIPVDLWPYMEPNFSDEDAGMIRRFGPFRGNVEEIVIEHGLYDGRFWLPRVRIAHAEGTAKGGRITLSIEQSFEYERVRALPPGVAQAVVAVPASSRDEDFGGYSRYGEWRRGNGERPPCRERGDTADLTFADSVSGQPAMRTRSVAGVRMRVIIPCDRDDLLRSPLLPGSIYGAGEELFTDADLGRLRDDARRALAMSSQADWSPRAVTWRYGLDDGLLRYNRVEALSAGVRAERELGRGYGADATLRLGVADLEPNAELFLRRRNGGTEYRAGVFRRLDVANAWGTPLGVSASLGALLLGRDDWMYHRALGVELGGTHRRVAGGPAFAWRLFAERHGTADVETNFAVPHNAFGTDFAPNIEATAGDYAGAAALVSFAHGIDPGGLQLSGHLRAEGATGEVAYGRASGELRIARDIGGGRTGAITAAAGHSSGVLPPQRRFYLGGASTLHADRVGVLAGDAFWLARAELSGGGPLFRPVVFADWGWAGARDRFLRTGARDDRISVGLGAAMLDGLLRFDVSRALDAPRRWGLDVFIDVR
jgi:hypothetical protein